MSILEFIGLFTLLLLAIGFVAVLVDSLLQIQSLRRRIEKLERDTSYV
jgi:hypothetical protein